MACQVTFVCVANRTRSVFSQFFFQKMLTDKDENLAKEIKVLSAGFVPQRLKDQLNKAKIAFPEPFFNRGMTRVTREFLMERGIRVPDKWRSRELTSDMVKESDLIITALPDQKEEMIVLYPGARERIFTIKELAEWDGYIIFEDYERPPLDHRYWHFVDEDPIYVSKILSVMEECLIRAFPNILRKLPIRTIQTARRY